MLKGRGRGGTSRVLFFKYIYYRIYIYVRGSFLFAGFERRGKKDSFFFSVFITKHWLLKHFANLFRGLFPWIIIIIIIIGRFMFTLFILMLMIVISEKGGKVCVGERVHNETKVGRRLIKVDKSFKMILKVRSDESSGISLVSCAP